jgi:hypothetical protein
MTGYSGESPYNMAVCCVPHRGWVVVQASAAAELVNPIVELSVLSPEGRSLASTLVMDAPPSFRVTLHLDEVRVGMSLRLQVKLISAEDTSVETIEVLPFTFVAPEET